MEVRETLMLNRALVEAIGDVERGRTYGADAFMEKVAQRWPENTEGVPASR